MIKTSIVIKTLGSSHVIKPPTKMIIPRKPPSSPSNSGDHAGEIDLAIEDNALAWLHLFMITMMIVISDDSDDSGGDDDKSDDVEETDDHRHVVHQVWLNLGKPTSSHCKVLFSFYTFIFMIIVVISSSFHVSVSFILVIPPLLWSSGCNANKKSY